MATINRYFDFWFHVFENDEQNSCAVELSKIGQQEIRILDASNGKILR